MKETKIPKVDVVIPEFQIGEYVYIVVKDLKTGIPGYSVMPTKIEWYKVYIPSKSKGLCIAYRAKIYGAGKSYMFYSRDIFKNKLDAEKESEKRNKEI